MANDRRKFDCLVQARTKASREFEQMRFNGRDAITFAVM